jgi:hypothetical protein
MHVNSNGMLKEMITKGSVSKEHQLLFTELAISAMAILISLTGIKTKKKSQVR